MPALAQESEQEMRPYVSGGYTYTYQDNDRNSDNGNGWFVGVGKAINQYWGWELSGSWDQFDSDGVANPNNWRQYGAKLDGMFFYSRDRAFSPYVGVGVGGKIGRASCRERVCQYV